MSQPPPLPSQSPNTTIDSRDDNTTLLFPLFHASPHYRWLVYIFSFVTVSTTSGVVYGWPALRQQLQQHDGSTLSEASLGAAFTAGAWSTQGCRFVTGLARDKLGCRRVCSFSLLSVALGFCGLAWSDANNAAALGCSLFVVGLGAGALLCMQPVSGLFPQSSGSVMTSLSGAFQVSGLVFLVLTSISANRQAVFSGFAVLVVLLAILAYVLLPPTATFDGLSSDCQPRPATTAFDNSGSVEMASSEQLHDENDVNDTLDADDTLDTNDDAVDNDVFRGTKGLDQSDRLDPSLSIPEDTAHTTIPQGQQQQDERPSLYLSRRSSASSLHDSLAGITQRRQILSGEYVLLVIWVSFTTTPMQYYVGSLGFQLEDNGDTTGFYSDLFSIIWAGSAVVSPGAGFLADRLGLGASEAVATLLAASSFFILASAGQTTLDFQVVGLLCNAIGRVFVVGLYFCHLGNRFGYKNYGTLAGLGLLVSAIVSLLQYPLIAAAANGHAIVVNLVCGAALLALLPYCFWMGRREYQEQQAAVEGNR